MALRIRSFVFVLTLIWTLQAHGQTSNDIVAAVDTDRRRHRRPCRNRHHRHKIQPSGPSHANWTNHEGQVIGYASSRRRKESSDG